MRVLPHKVPNRIPPDPTGSYHILVYHYGSILFKNNKKIYKHMDGSSVEPGTFTLSHLAFILTRLTRFL